MEKLTKHWIKCKALFLDNNELSEMLGKRDLDWDDFCFKITDLENFNECEDNTTRITLKSGFEININISFESMINLIRASE